MPPSFDNLDEAYRTLVPGLVNYASKHIYNKSLAIDAVHDAFVKAQIYLNKHPKAKVSSFLLKREVARACRRLNKYSVEVATDFSAAYD